MVIVRLKALTAPGTARVHMKGTLQYAIPVLYLGWVAGCWWLTTRRKVQQAALRRAANAKTVSFNTQAQKAAAEFDQQFAKARAAQEAPTNAAQQFGQQFEQTTPMLVNAAAEFERQFAKAMAVQEAPTNAALQFGQ
eukprot:scaffold85975_cov62-Phaeocystis_antarctica.AAC.1